MSDKNYLTFTGNPYEKPFVRLKGLTSFKIDVVKENCKAFETWLLN